MNQTIDKAELDVTLQNICEHKLFVNAPIYQQLLRYLVEKALLEEDIKEYTIGSDVFGIDYALDNNNSTVRSYMYKLRKKLASYYNETNNVNAIVFSIKKGQYNLSFEKPAAKTPRKITISFQMSVKQLVLIAGIILISSLTLWMHRQYTDP